MSPSCRNVIIVAILNYLLIIVVCAFSEMFFVADTAQEVQTLVRTAADMALEQAQATDDFFVLGNSYNTEGADGYNIYMERNGSFEKVSMYEGVYGIDASVHGNKEIVFKKLYDTPEFKQVASTFGNITSSISYYNDTRTGLNWYKLPKIAQVGLDITGRHGNITQVKTPSGAYVNSSVANGIIDLYGFNNAKRMGFDHTIGSAVDYFMTPISLGVTYVNPDLINQLFLNNLDLLMRAKYHENGTSLSTEQGGKGLYKGFTWADTITDTSLDSYNPINNGKFTLVRGTTRSNNNGFKTYNGIEPEIEYKVIDMYDSVNDDVLIMLFGANKTSSDGRQFSTKAEYLKHLDREKLDPATGLPYNEKLISVAKVTFYADVIIPYTSLSIRDFRGNIDSADKNFLDIQHKGTSGVTGFSGNDCFSYTRYFAVAP